MANSDAFYIELASDTIEVLTEFGKEFNVRSKGVTDLSTLTVTEGGTRNVWGLVSDAQAQSYAEVGSVQWTATKTLILAPDADPVEGEFVIVDGVSYPLDKIVAVKPADIVVVYLLDISK